MNKQKTNGKTRWGIIITLAVIVFLIAGTIFAQTNPQRGGAQRSGGGGQGFRGGAGGSGFGGHGGGGGPSIQNQFMMDPDVMDLVQQIKFLERINELEFSRDQVESLLDSARELRDILGDPISDVRRQLVSVLEDQRYSVAQGGSFDRSVLESIREDFQADHDPGELREQAQPIIEEAMSVLTEEQIEALSRPPEGAGPGPGGGFQGGGQGGQQGFGGGGGFRGGGEHQGQGGFQDRPEARQMAGGMIIGRILMDKNTVEALEIWLDAN